MPHLTASAAPASPRAIQANGRQQQAAAGGGGGSMRHAWWAGARPAAVMAATLLDALTCRFMSVPHTTRVRASSNFSGKVVS